MSRTTASDSTLTDSSSGFTARSLRRPHRSHQCPFVAWRNGAVIDEISELVDARNLKNEQMLMDRVLNTKLERDKLPEDTPLPIYLAHRQPRNPSPPSRWDKKRSNTPKKYRKLVSMLEAAATSAAAASAEATSAAAVPAAAAPDTAAAAAAASATAETAAAT
ncbi:uncharacterized protein LOC120449400 [Drosophila santomea]|uniref:uncharacterized protein LOC120449400 n=1 Tax=Drosophila santomea TaxID=129105 RepID=UPI0019543628|nr:uncharacterized protein LOC120449400 [Drosophila santomea]